MESFGFDKLTPFLTAKSLIMMEASLRLLLTGIVAYIGILAVRFGLHKLEIILLTVRENDDNTRLAAEKRVKTLVGLLLTIGLTLVWVVAVVMGLDQIGLDI